MRISLLLSLLISFSLCLNLRNFDIPEYKAHITNEGYKFEEHQITTEDGYILSVWRIPGKLSQKNINQTPIILQHGLLDDSWTWFMLKGKRSLPFTLVEDGYDVWLPNVRGNMFSSGHVNKTMDHRNPFGPYWDFSFSEMSDYDFPAVVNYIKTLTHFDKIDYIGHSQGTTIFFLKYMADPEYIKQNIKKFVALGPVPSVSNIESPVVKMLAKDNVFKKYYPTKNCLNLGTKIGKYLYLLCGPLNELCKATAEAMGSMSKTGRVDYKAIQKLFRYE